MSNSSSLVIVTPASASVEMFSSINLSVIVKSPFAFVSSVRISAFSPLDSSSCSPSVSFWSLPYFVAARFAPS